MANDFPLCKKLGLGVGGQFILASDVERILAAGVRVYGLTDRGPDRWTCFSRSDGPTKGDTHTALLINIEPIRRETERSLLEECVKVLAILNRIKTE